MQREFVILAHRGHGPDHYDLMLSCDGALATWQLDSLPGDSPAHQPIEARKLPDHRLTYLSYEGSVTGNRGQVQRADHGTYELVDQSPSRWEFRLQGTSVCGLFELVEIAPEEDRWTLCRINES